MKRIAAALVAGFVTWALGFLTIFSFNVLADRQFLRGTFFDNIDYLTSNVLLPAGGFLITVFAGWVMCRNSSADELDVEAGSAYDTWRFLARWVAPAAVLLVFLHATGILDMMGLV